MFLSTCAPVVTYSLVVCNRCHVLALLHANRPAASRLREGTNWPAVSTQELGNGSGPGKGPWAHSCPEGNAHSCPEDNAQFLFVCWCAASVLHISSTPKATLVQVSARLNLMERQVRRAGAGPVQFPFTFTLPHHLPPSFYFDSGTAEYVYQLSPCHR
jgi:hypothetical protein